MRRSLLFLLPVLILVSCQTSKLLRQHHRELTFLAQGSLDEPETFDRLATMMVGVLEDALMQPTPDKTVNFLRKFSNQNQAELRQIHSRLQDWQRTLKPGEKLRFVAQSLRQPYAAELARLVPQTLELMREDDRQLSSLRRTLLLFRVRQWINS